MVQAKRLNMVGAIILVTLALLMGSFLTMSINAQTNENAITLAISPQLLEVTANPGEVFTNTFRLTNASEVDLAIKTTPKNFTPQGEEGAVNLTEDDTTYAIANWVTVSPSTATIASNTSQDFEVTIDVPADAEPGSHFGSVVFQTIPPQDESAAAVISQEIAPVILVRIAGDVTQIAEIEEFRSTEAFWSNESTISFISRIKNTGTAHFKPTGQITVKNMFGSEVAKLDIDKKNVLPDSIRQITTDWTGFGFLFGRYSAELTIVAGEDNQITTATTSFTVIPYQTLLPIAIGVSVVGFIIYKGRKRLMLAGKALSGSSKDSDK